MQTKICHDIKRQQHILKSLLESATVKDDIQQLTESALNVAHSLDIFSKNIIGRLHSILSTTALSRFMKHDIKSPRDVIFTGEVLCLIEDLTITSCDLRATILHQIGVSVGDTEKALHENAFSIRNDSTFPEGVRGSISSSSSLDRIAFDLGGTLIKIAYFQEAHYTSMVRNLYWIHQYMYDVFNLLEVHYRIDILCHCNIDRNLKILLPNLIRFNASTAIGLHRVPVDSLREAIQSLIDNKIINRDTQVHATGGGALKYFNVFKELLSDSKFHSVEEMPSVVCGTDILHLLNSGFIRYNLKTGQTEFLSVDPEYPYLIVNIGSGISFLKVTAKGIYERVTGTSIGGGTMHGLMALLLGFHGFERFTSLYTKGTNCLDTFFPEINTTALPTCGLKASFGFWDGHARQEDSIRSISDMVAHSIGQVAFLVAKQYGLRRIIFTGSYTMNYSMTMVALVSAIAYMFSIYGEESMEVLRPVFGGYAGVLGCLFKE